MELFQNEEVFIIEKPSEKITAFMNFLESSSEIYKEAFEAVGLEDSRLQTFLHDMEFAPTMAERNKIATKLQRSRRKRREAKDKVKLYENVNAFYEDKQTQLLLKGLRRLLNEQLTAEKYLAGPREFKNRVD